MHFFRKVETKLHFSMTFHFQVVVIDFSETFAPVAKFIRCILALGTTMDWEIYQMDVKTTFLNGYWK